MTSVTGAPDSPRAGSAKKLLDKFEELSPSKRQSVSPRSPKPFVKDIGADRSVSDNPILLKDRKDKRNTLTLFQEVQSFFGYAFVPISTAVVAALGFCVLPAVYFGRQAGGTNFASILASLGL